MPSLFEDTEDLDLGGAEVLPVSQSLRDSPTRSPLPAEAPDKDSGSESSSSSEGGSPSGSAGSLNSEDGLSSDQPPAKAAAEVDVVLPATVPEIDLGGGVDAAAAPEGMLFSGIFCLRFRCGWSEFMICSEV